ncbi:MAG: InlB B-repeat-containing protein, partial [Erysipelotrichales bacterium]|nr:InlB B-repeat-containing protein [Erysipelotrichales bacterium]
PNSHQYGTDTTLVNPTRVGHTFLGWFLNEDGTGTVITVLGANDFTSDIILYAAWAANDYTITFDVNGGGALVPNTQDVTFAQAYTLPTPTRTGHTFNGWYNGTDLIPLTGTWNIADDVTLVASWTANTYTITFDVNGGDALVPNTQEVTFAQNFTLPTPTRTGFTFTGWYNGTDSIALTGTWNIASDITLIASWTANTYTITFDVNGGNVLVPGTQDVTFAQNFTLPTPTREGHTFNGWLHNGNPFTAGTWDIANDITIVAQWTANTYTITFNVNGGNALNPNTQDVTFGQAYTLPEPTRTGHTFNGWFNGTELISLTGTWVIANNVTLIASWTANTYTITFDVNGGYALNPNTQTVTFGESYVLPIPTKTGYEFVGWNYNETYVASTGTFWNISGNITLVAQWSYETFVITFDVNGGNALPSNTQTVGFGLTYTLPTPTRTGHTFNGWFNGPELVSQTGTWELASNTILVAEWTANTYTITFDVNGGNILNPSTLDVTFGEAYTLPEPTRTGFTFTSWYNGTDLVNLTGTTWNISGHITLRANWTANTYTITFDVNGGNALVSNTQNVVFDQAYTLPTPTRTGHTFNGWYNGTDLMLLTGTWNIANDVTLVASWTANTYTITFDVNGGNALNPNTQDVTFGQAYTLPEPTRTGHTFNGWYNGTDLIPLTGAWNIANDITLIASWTANTYTITFDVNGGNTLIPNTQDVTFGQAYTLPIPTKTGHTFNGWYNGTDLMPLTGTWDIANDVTLVASWTANTYTITFDVNGGNTLTPATQNVVFDQAYTLPTPTKTGHTFNGWYNGTELIPLTGTWDIANDITLVASWTANTYTITFDVNGGNALVPNTQNVTFAQAYTLPTPTRTGHTFNGWYNGTDLIPLTGTWNIANDITLVASWTANTYTITFNVNGGNALVPNTQNVTFDQTYTLPTPTRTGHTFNGWYNGTELIPLTGTWDIASNVTLVANWTANTYTVTFNVNGGNALVTNTQTVTFGQTYTLPTPTRTGYTFAGWYDGLTNLPLTGIWDIANDITLVAEWNVNTYIITFNVNGGNALNPTTQDITFGQSFTLPTPTRTGYTFSGWYNGIDLIALTGLSWDISGNITLRAEWTANTYIITFNVNGGDALVPSTQNVTFDQTYTLPSPTRTGYTFAGWYNGTDLIPLTGTWDIASDVTLVASWTANTYTITFNVNGGNALVPNTQNVTFGQSYTLPEPTRTGHTFNGWYNGTDLISLTGTWNITNDVTLVASWTANTYTITFDVNGGSTLNPSTQNVTFDQTYTLPTPARTGFTFAGWYNGTELIPLMGTWDIANDVTLVASWTANTYTITFDVNGGNTLTPATQTVTFAQAYTLPTPTRTGHTFNGWYNGTELIPLTGTWDIANNVTLIASWTANTYTITFDVNGGNTLSPNTQAVTFGQTYSLPTPTRTGFTFAGWYNGSTNVSSNGTWDIADNVTLRAEWTANTYTITFNVNGGNALLPNTQDVIFGENYTLPTPTRLGHTFSGWYNGTDLVPLTGTWDIASNVTLRAEWNANEYVITFNVNGGEALPSDTLHVTFGSTYTLPEPIRTGYTFNGWYHGLNNILLNGTWGIASDVTLVAAWTANTYTITFDVNGGNTLTPATQTVTFDQAYSLPTPTKTGHTFNGWYNGTDLIPLTGTWNIASNVTLVANWTANTYTITFDVNNGDALVPNTQDVVFDQTYTLPTPTRLGYTFTGWYNGTDLIPLTGTWDIATNVTLVANWTASTFIVTFDSTFAGVNVANVTVTFGQPYTFQDLTGRVPTHIFNGWYDGATNMPLTGIWDIPNNVNLVASWSERFIDMDIWHASGQIFFRHNDGEPLTIISRTNTAGNVTYTAASGVTHSYNVALMNQFEISFWIPVPSFGSQMRVGLASYFVNSPDWRIVERNRTVLGVNGTDLILIYNNPSVTAALTVRFSVQQAGDAFNAAWIFTGPTPTSLNTVSIMIRTVNVTNQHLIPAVTNSTISGNNNAGSIAIRQWFIPNRYVVTIENPANVNHQIDNHGEFIVITAWALNISLPSGWWDNWPSL